MALFDKPGRIGLWLLLVSGPAFIIVEPKAFVWRLILLLLFEIGLGGLALESDWVNQRQEEYSIVRGDLSSSSRSLIRGTVAFITTLLLTAAFGITTWDIKKPEAQPTEKNTLNMEPGLASTTTPPAPVVSVRAPQDIPKLPVSTKGKESVQPVTESKLKHSAPVEVPIEGQNITTEIGPSVDPKYAFETRFILTNHNPLSITSAGYMCVIQNADYRGVMVLDKPVNMNLAASGPIEDLPSGLSRSLYCDFVGPGFIVDRMDMPVVQIWVVYKYKNNNESKGFQFFAKRRFEDKTFVWLPGGAGKELGPPPSKP